MDFLTNNTSEVYLNGEFLPVQEAKISVLDRGFIFGDGVYEVVPAYKRQPLALDAHVARLLRSLAAIRLETGKSSQDWHDLFMTMIERASTDDTFIYLQVTRGVAKRDHQFPNPPVAPTIFMSSTPLKRPSAAMREEGLKAVTLPDDRWLHCEIKSISLLGNILAKQYAVDNNADEVIQIRNGMLTEGSASNIWVVKDGVLMAPLKNNLILQGVRMSLLEGLAQKAGVEFLSQDIALGQVLDADELLLTSATKEVLPICLLDGQPVGNGKPGAVYQKLRSAYDEMLEQLVN